MAVDATMTRDAEFGQYWSRDIIDDLSQFGLIAVEGADAKTFLASLFTGDVRLVSPDQGQFTSWCDGKGRIITTFWLFMHNEVYYLLLPNALLASTLARLQQFLFRSKAIISDASDTLARLGLSGSALAKRLADVLAGGLPVARGETRAFGECTVVTLSVNPQPRWLLVGTHTGVKAIRDRLSPQTLPVKDNVWPLLDILSGLPWLQPETSAEFVPQMLNLEALGGLCFSKGCYPGQEVVARLHYRGQLKRRLYLAYVESEQVPPPCARLASPTTSESVGMVISAAPAETGKIALLAVVLIEQQALGTIHLLELQGPRLEFDEQYAAIAVNA